MENKDGFGLFVSWDSIEEVVVVESKEVWLAESELSTGEGERSVLFIKFNTITEYNDLPKSKREINVSVDKEE